MKVNLVNKTHYQDDHIRAFIKKQMPEERPDLCKRGAKPLTVEVVYTRMENNSSSGCAFVKSNWMKVRLSKNLEPDKIDFAHVIAHELAHTRGMKSEYMMRNSAKYGRVGSWRSIYGWANDLPLEKKPQISKPKPKQSLREWVKKYGRGLTLEDGFGDLYELLTPKGYCMEDGCHGAFCDSPKEVKEVARNWKKDKCPPDCDCFF